MPTERMFDITIEVLGGGGARLEQSAGSLEGPAIIELHPAQIRLLAERAGLLKPQPANLGEHLTAGHVRRLRALVERIEEFHNEEAFFDEIFERCIDGAEIWLHVRAIAEQAQELVADLGDIEPAPTASPLHVECTDGPAASDQANLFLDVEEI